MILTIQDQEEFFSFPFNDDLIMQVSTTESDMVLVTVYTNNPGMPERSFFGDDGKISGKYYDLMINAVKEAHQRKSKNMLEIINLNELFELEKKKVKLSNTSDIFFEDTKSSDNLEDDCDEDTYDDDDFDFEDDLLDI